MRTLLQILHAAKNGDKPSYDECYYAMLALDALSTLDDMAVEDMLERSDNNPDIKTFYEERWNREKRCYAVSPQHYVGKSN